MGRLAKHSAGRQRELFARADLPAHTPRLEHYAAVERRRVDHEPRPVLWEGMGSWVRQLCAFPPSYERSARQDERLCQVARSLTVEKVRASRDDEGLAMVERELADWRNNDLTSAFTRAAIGELLVEVRNRRQLLAIGRDQAKPKGPRMDPTRLPDAALERLIQGHPDLVLVEQLRAERARRHT